VNSSDKRILMRRTTPDNAPQRRSVRLEADVIRPARRPPNAVPVERG
jgi:hypothetical protein